MGASVERHDDRIHGGHSIDNNETPNSRLQTVILEPGVDKNNQGSNPSNSEDEKLGDPTNTQKEGSNIPPSFLRKYAGGLRSRVSSNFHWVAQNNSWSKWKPVIRCALAAWISGILFIIPQTEKAMGQVCHAFDHSQPSSLQSVLIG